MIRNFVCIFGVTFFRKKKIKIPNLFRATSKKISPVGNTTTIYPNHVTNYRSSNEAITTTIIQRTTCFNHADTTYYQAAGQPKASRDPLAHCQLELLSVLVLVLVFLLLKHFVSLLRAGVIHLDSRTKDIKQYFNIL